MSLSQKARLTGTSYIDSLLWGTKWTNSTLTYSFGVSQNDFAGVKDHWGATDGFLRGFNAAEQQAVRNIYKDISGFANLNFVEMTENRSDAILRFGAAKLVGAGAVSITPGESAPNGDVWMGLYGVGSILDVTPGKSSYRILMHEIGHSLGLKHPFDESVGFPIAKDSERYFEFTIMDYYGVGRPPGVDWYEYGTPQNYSRGDMAALQALYGANFNANDQNTVYKVYEDGSMTMKNGADALVTLSDGVGPLYRTLWDGGGVDTYDFGSLKQNQIIDLRPGEGSAVLPGDQLEVMRNGVKHLTNNVYNAFLFNGDVRSLIENVVAGSGDDVVTGNAANNTIKGGAGKDSIYGGDGDDVLYGGLGNDVLYAGNSSGTPFGRDYLFGDDGDDKLYGGIGKFYLYGGNGNDYLDGSQGKEGFFSPGYGVDTVIGNVAEIDTVYYGHSKEAVQVSLLLGRGYGGEAEGDSYTSIENIFGSAFHDKLIGDAKNNKIDGLDGNDYIVGGAGNDRVDAGYGDDVINSGSGNDFMYGSAGKDTFVFDRGFGLDVIGDFKVGVGQGDILDFSTDLFSSLQSVVAAAKQVGSNTVIQYDAYNSITLQSFQLSSLIDCDIRFHSIM